MNSNPRIRGRQMAEQRNRERAQDLYNFLHEKGVFVMVDGKVQSVAWEAVRDWMSAEFHRGIDYGKRIQARGATR